MNNSITHTVSEIAHGLAKVAHILMPSPGEKAVKFLEENGITNISTTSWNSVEGCIIVAKGSGEFYNVEHDSQLRRSLLNIVLFSSGAKNGEERLSQAMDNQREIELLEKVKLPAAEGKNFKVLQLFKPTSQE